MSSQLCVTLLWYTKKVITDLLKNVSSAIIFMDRLWPKQNFLRRFVFINDEVESTCPILILPYDNSSW